MDLLFEAAGEYASLSTSPFVGQQSQREVLAAVGNTIVRLDAYTSETISTVSLAAWAPIIACTALPDGAILVALADSSLLLIPRECLNANGLKSIPWPIQPLGLLLTKDTVIVTCKRQLYCTI